MVCTSIALAPAWLALYVAEPRTSEPSPPTVTMSVLPDTLQPASTGTGWLKPLKPSEVMPTSLPLPLVFVAVRAAAVLALL